MKPGERVEKLILLSVNEELSKQKKRQYGLFQCDCGNTKTLRVGHVTSLSTKSCGCSKLEEIQKYNQTKNLNNQFEIGKTYGYLTYIQALNESNKAGRQLGKFQCKCGNKVDLALSYVKSGTQSCGCIKHEKVSDSRLTILRNIAKQRTLDSLPIIGTQYQFLTYLGNPIQVNGRIHGDFKCTCGNILIAHKINAVLNSPSNSCGCRKETRLEEFTNSHLALTKYQSRVYIDSKKYYIPDFIINPTTYLNVDGLYWHNEENKGKDYHYNLRKDFESKNLRILQFYEDEIYNKPHIIQSMVNNLKGLNTVIGARKCEIKEVSAGLCKTFVDMHHLQGHGSYGKGMGLYLNNELVALMTYKKKDEGIDILRFCNKHGLTIQGGFSKLLNHIQQLEQPKFIDNWVDMRYGTGNHLASYGFEKIKETIGWCWGHNTGTRYNRLQCRANMDNRKLTEAQHAQELKYFKIFDAGQALFRKIC